jgi:hypothetical protein
MAEAQQVSMPARLTAEDLDVVRADPLCILDDQDEMNSRIGWLICAYDAIVSARIDDSQSAHEEAEYYAELNRGYAKDRI